MGLAPDKVHGLVVSSVVLILEDVDERVLLADDDFPASLEIRLSPWNETSELTFPRALHAAWSHPSRQSSTSRCNPSVRSSKRGQVHARGLLVLLHLVRLDLVNLESMNVLAASDELSVLLDKLLPLLLSLGRSMKDVL